jgi:hypothetical protein
MDAQPVQPGRLDRRQPKHRRNSLTRSGSVGCCSVRRPGVMGYGGVSRVARLAEASWPTVRRGAAELDQPADPQGRIRQHGGPRRLCERDPGLLVALDGLVDDRLLICAGAGGSNGHRSGID